MKACGSVQIGCRCPPRVMTACELYIAHSVTINGSDQHGVDIWSTDHEALQTSSRRPLLSLEGHSSPVSALAMADSADGSCTLLCAASRERTIIWEIETALRNPQYCGETIAEDDWDEEISAAVFDATGTLVVLCVGIDVYVLEVHSGEQFARMEGHTASVTAAAFSPHVPHLLVSVSEDRTFKVWDLAARRLFYQSAILSAFPLLSLAMDPLLNRFAVGARNGLVWVWEVVDAAEGVGKGLCRELQVLDLQRAFAREGKEMRQAQVEKEVNSVPVVISSLPAWAMSDEAKEAHQAKQRLENLGPMYGNIQRWETEEPHASNPDEEADLEEDQSYKLPVLLLQYLAPPPPPPPPPPKDDGKFRPPGSDAISQAQAQAQVTQPPLSLLMATPTALMTADMRSYRIRTAVNFQRVSASSGGSGGGSLFHCYASWVQPDESRSAPPLLYCAGGGAFEHSMRVHVLTSSASEPIGSGGGAAAGAGARRAEIGLVAEAKVEKIFRFEEKKCKESNADVVDGTPYSRDRVGAQEDRAYATGGHEDEALTVFMKAPPPDDSPLRNTYTNGSGASGGGGGNSAKGKGKSSGKKGKVENKPVTFHTKIKSSGYGSGPAPIPLGGHTKASRERERRRQSGGRSRSGGTSLTPQQYPVECGELSAYQKKHALSRLHGGAILAMRFSSDASQLATASVDRTMRTLRLPVAKHQGDGTSYVGHNGKVLDCCWSHASGGGGGSGSDSGKLGMLLTASADGTAALWVRGRSDPALIFSHKKQQMRTAAQRRPRDDRVGGHSGGDGEPFSPPAMGSAVGGMGAKPNCAFGAEVRAAQFFHLDKFVVLAAAGTVYMYKYQVDHLQDKKNDLNRLCNNSKYKLVQFWTLPSQTVHTLCCVNSFHSHLVLAGGSDRSVCVLDAAAGKVSRTLIEAHTRPVHTLAMPQLQFAGDGSQHNLFLTAAADSAVQVWDLRLCAPVMKLSGHTNRVHAIGADFSPCMRYLASGSEDKAVYLYDLRRGTFCAKLTGHTDVVSDVAFNPLYPQLASASFDATVRFYAELQPDSGK